jgi:hypothetical protein
MLANLSHKPQEIQMKLKSKLEKKLTLNGYVLDKEVSQQLSVDDEGWVTVKLEPWQLPVIKSSS